MIGAPDMKVRLTAEQKQAKLDNLAENYTDTAIKMASRPELAKWCEGIVPSIKSKRKDELAEELVEALKETRDRIVLQVAENPTPIDRHIEERKTLATEFEDPTPDVAKRLYETLRVIAIDSQTPDQLLDGVLTLLTKHTASEVRKYKDSTVKKRKTTIVKLLRSSCDPETIFKPLITDTVESFIRRYHAALSDIVEEVNSKDRLRVAKNVQNLTEVDGTGCLDFAREALTKLERWTDVSIALILVTGRRMAEIHSTDTVFKKVDDCTVSFEGQLKTKGRGDVGAFNIPTLLLSDLVLAGIEFLKQQEKLYTATDNMTVSDIVNAKVSMGLSRAVKANMTKYGISVYKDCRVVYAELCWTKYANHAKTSKEGYFSQILGHGDNDVKTALSYTKFHITD